MTINEDETTIDADLDDGNVMAICLVPGERIIFAERLVKVESNWQTGYSVPRSV